MPAPLIAALVCTIAFLVTTAYFFMGSIPLLILKHDTPMDAWFVRRFFEIYFVAAAVTAGATAISYALVPRPAMAAGAAALVILALVLRRRLIAAMASFGQRIQAADLAAIPGFRKAHAGAILINLAQLVLGVWSLTTLAR